MEFANIFTTLHKTNINLLYLQLLSHAVLIADMAVQNVVGDAFRGATWVALHNGGGVGW